MAINPREWTLAPFPPAATPPQAGLLQSTRRDRLKSDVSVVAWSALAENIERAYQSLILEWEMLDLVTYGTTQNVFYFQAAKDH